MKILHLDIETAPNKVYVWGLWNQNVGINQIVEPGYTMCWAAKWHGDKTVHFDSLKESGTYDMLMSIWQLLDEADAVVHYNGDKFDIPTLNKEFLLYGIEPPTPSQSIDILRVVKQRFRFPSNKLDYVAQALGLGGKTKHTGMELWKDCMDMQPKAWKLMERYNKQDVKLLEKVYKEVLPWIKNHPNHALYKETNDITCTNCGSEHVHKCGIEHTKTQTYQRYRCTKCHTPLRGRATIVRKDQRPHIIQGSKL